MSKRDRKKQQEAYSRRQLYSKAVKNDRGEVLHREVELDPLASQTLMELYVAYERKFGHPPPDDMTLQETALAIGRPMPTEQESVTEVVKMLRQAGVDPHLVWAFEQTSVLLTEDNMHLVDDSVVEVYRRSPETFAKLPAEVQAKYRVLE